MCGIAGIKNVYRSDNDQNYRDLKAMMSILTPRGPDHQNTWQSNDSDALLCHTRLSIIDVSQEANQPMIDDNSGLVIVYNGELYNYLELRLLLQGRNYSFKTSSDTEVVLKMYQEFGENMLPYFRGMFAISIYDEDRKSLFLARDHYGIKPLYYFNNGNIFAFSSQVKSLEKCSFVSSSVSSVALVSFLCTGSVSEPFSIRDNIKPLQPGSYIIVDKKGKISQKKYYSLLENIVNIENNYIGGAIDINRAMIDTVKAHLVSDVHLTTFLSSGVDSTSILDKVANVLGDNTSTTTLGFTDFQSTKNDETILAKAISNDYLIKNNTGWINKDIFFELKDGILKSMDQPTIDGINTYLLCNYLKKLNIKVGLSGIGADELFSGYPTFRDVPKIANFPTFNNKLITNSLSYLSLQSSRLLNKPKIAFLPKYSGGYSRAYFLRRSLFVPEQLKNLLPETVYNEGVDGFNNLMFNEEDVNSIQNEHLKITFLEFEFYLKNQLLRDSDWAGMANSVEIRTPYIDKLFIDNLIKAIVHKDNISKASLLATIQNKSVKRRLQGRSKTGFFVPVSKWIKSENNSYHSWALEISRKYI